MRLTGPLRDPGSTGVIGRWRSGTARSRSRVAAMSSPIVAAAVLFVQPAMAEVVEQDDDHFVTQAEAVVDADSKATWLALISPARWWSDEHTWSGDASNLTLTPQAGGCFCERIPEVEDAERITLEGSVEHMRVVQSYPERALRMRGSLGPLQSEPVTGILTIALSETAEGTRIVWEYNVGGSTRYEVSTIAVAVDAVMTQQLNGIADLLGRIDESAGPDEESPDDQGPNDEGLDDYSDPGQVDETAADEPIDKGDRDTPDARSNVDDAFLDLADG